MASRQISALSAVDVHVHIESDGHGHFSLDDELMDASAASGHAALSSADIADAAAAHADVLIPFGSVDPLRGPAPSRRRGPW